MRQSKAADYWHMHTSALASCVWSYSPVGEVRLSFMHMTKAVGISGKCGMLPSCRIDVHCSSSRRSNLSHAAEEVWSYDISRVSLPHLAYAYRGRTHATSRENDDDSSEVGDHCLPPERRHNIHSSRWKTCIKAESRLLQERSLLQWH